MKHLLISSLALALFGCSFSPAGKPQFAPFTANERAQAQRSLNTP